MATIASTVTLGPAQLDRLAAWDLATVDLRVATELDLAGTRGLLVNSYATADAAVIARMPELEVISTVSVGFDHIDVVEAGRRAITVTTAPVLSDAVADLTIALITMTARRLREATDDMARGLWSSQLLGTDVRAKHLLLVGFGRIGQEVAARALAAKMTVSVFDVRDELPAVAGVERVATLADGLARADVVSLHVDLNPSTRHLIDAAALALMKPTSILVNTARGGVVDQAALTRALVEGRIAGAGLDVLEVEPPPADDPLLQLPNVVVLPHIGSATVETRLAMLDCAVDNLATCLRGEPCGHALVLSP